MSRSSASACRHSAVLLGAGFRNAPAVVLLLAVMSAAPAFNTFAWSEEAGGPHHGASDYARAYGECQIGEEACPAVLRVKRGSNTVEASGWVSGEHPVYYFKFDARAGQHATIHVAGGNIKTGPGIPITMPDGNSDALEVGAPFTLPVTGTYIIELHANTMSSGPFGRFRISLRVD
jgi:hypothetical protein